VLRQLVAAINSGDAAKLATFIASNYVLEAGTPTPAERAQRLMQAHENLGDLAITGLDQIDESVVEISAKSASEGPLTMRVTIGADAKIRAIQLLVGG
jgi:hypothetical protein